MDTRLGCATRRLGSWQGGPIAVLAAVFLAACGASQAPYDSLADGAEAKWVDVDAFAAGDDFKLHLHNWQAANRREPRGIIIALHGTNDHAGRFERPAAYWSEKGLLTYAYDQRGFGESTSGGPWAGTQALAKDLVGFADLIARSHPGVPITLLGESLGGGVVLVALAEEDMPDAVKRAVLVAPAVERGATEGGLGKAGLWTVANAVPALPYPTEHSLRSLSEDEALTEEVVQDPNVRKTIRADAAWGMAELMDAAAQSAEQVELPVLVIYGGDDMVLDADAVLDMFGALKSEEKEFCYLADSGHLLLHETPGADEESEMPEAVWETIADWQRRGGRPEIC